MGEQMCMRTAVGGSCFNRTCRIYAPAYRQASVLALLHLKPLAKATAKEKDGLRPPWNPIARVPEVQQAIDLAYDDIRRAFVAFVDDPLKADRPFVLAGHSQGTMHLVRLLQEEVENHPVRRRRFVHAYLAGFGVPMELFSQGLQCIRPSSSATDVGTVSSWRTAATRHPNHKLLTPAAYFSGEGWKIIDGEVLTMNPISWASGAGTPASDPEHYKGAYWPLPCNMDPRPRECGKLPSGMSLRFGRTIAGSRSILGAQITELTPIEAGAIVAQVDDHGFVRVPHMKQQSLFSLTERDWLLYHDLDCALFHKNLQDNVALRLQAWCPSSRLLGRVQQDAHGFNTRSQSKQNHRSPLAPTSGRMKEAIGPVA